MIKNLERVRYFKSQLLSIEDFQKEQSYLLDRFRRHNRYLHGWGVASGLEVSVSNDNEVLVSPGLAIDCAGKAVARLTRSASQRSRGIGQNGRCSTRGKFFIIPMTENQIKNLIKQAHQIFGKTSIYEVMDLDREAAIEVLHEYYEQPTEQQLEKYFAILDIIRDDENGGSNISQTLGMMHAV